MVVTVSKEQHELNMSNLDPLPPSSDTDFWEHAELNTPITPQRIHSGDNHVFIRVTGRAAKCTHCDWGFDLDPGDYIKDGHLYRVDGRLVI